MRLLLAGFVMMGLCAEHSSHQPVSAMPEKLFEFTRLQVDEDEIKIVDHLIALTKEQLKNQERLKSLMVQFQQCKEEFTQGNQTKPHTAKLIRLGREIYELITQEHVTHLFAKDYLDELQFFSSIAGKKAMGS